MLYQDLPLTNAGLIMRDAWADVAYNGDTTLYKEMQISVDEMKNGVSETEAIYHFGNRCIIPEIKKFASTIIQGIEKGNSEPDGSFTGAECRNLEP